MEFHEIANIFPLVDGDEFDELVQDIKANGVLMPIVIHDQKILDGRNRWRACQELGVDCPSMEWAGMGSPLAYVVSLNLHRRHLTTSQRAALAVDMMPMYEAEAKERQGSREDIVAIMPPSDKGKARDKAAADFKTSPRYVQDAKKIKEDAPELFDEIKSGGKTVTQAKREIKERKREAKREQNREIIGAAPTIEAAIVDAKFSTIVVDPPWDWGDEKDADQLGRSRPTYSTMTIDELLAFPLGSKAADDCHLYLWITNRSLPKGFALLEAWGFRYITCLTWCKPSIGMGNYYRGSTEQVLFGVKGSQGLKRKDVGTWFAAPRGGQHSAKPNEFYQLLETCSPGPYLDVFARQELEGWTTWGGEL